jgi:HSP20 family protein
MSLIRYEPWSLLDEMRRDMDRLFVGARPAPEDGSSVCTSAWVPSVDIREESDRFVLYADVPGVDPKDIELSAERGVLTIRGERPCETDEEARRFARMERARGVFYRRFSLPDSADPERITARSEHGVLEVTVPKRQDVMPRRISVTH